MNSTETEEGESTDFSRICWTRDPLPSQTTFQAMPERFKGFSGPVG
jgi:hypothetical protein